MTRRFPFAAAIAALAIFAASALGVAVFWGATRLAAPTGLSAEVRLDPVVLPSGIDVDPDSVATFLTERMTQAAAGDVAIRMTLGAENVTKMIDVAFPRLVTPSSIRGMFDRIPPLKAVLSLGQFRMAARVTIANYGDAPLEDVAITLPSTALAELPTGERLEIFVPKTGPNAVRVGAIEPGTSVSFAAWLTESATEGDIAASIRLGAAGGAQGPVHVYGAEGWLGEELAVRPWARWLVGAVLVGAALSSLAVLVLILLGVRGGGRREPAASRA